MKKINYLVLTLAVIAVFGFTSCKKECTCTTTMDGEVLATVTTEVKGKCSEGNSTIDLGGTITETKCD